MKNVGVISLFALLMLGGCSYVEKSVERSGTFVKKMGEAIEETMQDDNSALGKLTKKSGRKARDIGKKIERRK